jgi:hypothetical protein
MQLAGSTTGRLKSGTLTPGGWNEQRINRTEKTVADYEKRLEVQACAEETAIQKYTATQADEMSEKVSIYCQSNDGLIHLINVTMSEFTVCGDAWDGEAKGDLEKDPQAWKEIPATKITCPKCCEIIRSCRGVKITPPRRA